MVGTESEHASILRLVCSKKPTVVGLLHQILSLSKEFCGHLECCFPLQFSSYLISGTRWWRRMPLVFLKGWGGLHGSFGAYCSAWQGLQCLTMVTAKRSVDHPRPSVSHKYEEAEQMTGLFQWYNVKQNIDKNKEISPLISSVILI